MQLQLLVLMLINTLLLNTRVHAC